MIAMADKNYMTAGEVQEALGVTKWRVSQWIRQGVLTFIRNDYDRREKLIPKEQVDKLMRAPGRKSQA